MQTEYILVNETIYDFERKCQALINNGYKPSSGIATYSMDHYDGSTYSMVLTQFILQTFIKDWK